MITHKFIHNRFGKWRVLFLNGFPQIIYSALTEDLSCDAS